MALSRLQSDSDAGAPVRLVAERLKASGKLDGLIVRIGFLGQPDDLRGPILERLMSSDQVFGSPLMATLCAAQERATGEAQTDFTNALKESGAPFSRRVLLIAALHHWNAIMAGRQGIDPKEIAVQSLAMGHIGLWFGRFSKTHSSDSCFAAMAMHGLGVGVMAATFGDVYGDVWREADGSSRTLEAIEIERLGIHHGEAAAVLAKSFSMHADVSLSLQRHVLPIAEVREFPLMMGIAEQCAASMGWDGGIKRKWGELPTASMLRLGLKETDLATIADDVRGEAKLIFG